jgi:two-component system, chemotaxis family, CheB/CheR fusion protein
VSDTDTEPDDEPADAEPEPDAAGTVEDEAAFEELLAHLRDERGFDFTGYKRASLVRRFRKRMHEVHAEDFASYLARLEAEPDEVRLLFDTILINVTSFRRDPEAWDRLVEDVLPQIVERADGGTIRCWSAGCASGEEPYTLAIHLCQAVGDEAFRQRVKIYATDADEAALEQARAGVCRTAALEDAFGREVVERYFDVRGNEATFRTDLRRSIIFGRHDLVQNPPISRIDLLLCRNTLMYLTSEVQHRILASFHFALREGGYLFLGKSEALVTRTNLFRPVDLRSHLFVKNGAATPPRVAVTQVASGPRVDAAQAGSLLEPAFEAHPFAQLVVDAQENLVFANRQARLLFGIGTSQLRRPLRDLDLSYRPVEMRSLLSGILATGRPVLVADVETTTATGDHEVFDVHLVSLAPGPGPSVGALVTYLPVGQYKVLRDELERSQRELETAYEELQSVVEELETTNEELQSTNEELETTNEELHSTNEELETMNEELQSTNEELEGVNTALRTTSVELHTMNRFLEAILRSLKAGVVVLGPDLAIRAWNRRSEDLWGLRADEVLGGHFLNLDIGLPVDRLRSVIRDAFSATAMDQEIELEAVNRRGQPIRCTVSISPLLSERDEPDAVLLVTEVV